MSTTATTPPPPARRLTADLPMLAAFVLLCLGVAAIGGWWTAESVGTWYRTLRKPAWTPPGWVFGPVWTVLYILMATAAWLVWRRRHEVPVRVPLTFFGVQLALNLAWSGLFFAMRRPDLALLDIAALWLVLAATTATFWRVRTLAGALLVPYLLWVTFASTLNAAIWQLNR